ncbi:RIP metalloprotease RseP [Patescibacteria group bacterium]|nr:RIP metalloprotease RseP [Patescibacteria group bacterium]MBU1673608.1 RIP metalloprotease RseP [Patescibacteria group bacterium]MBU1964030.1 RIP metalloprotease RseP [Patescibacteria group bacterium]
MLTTILVFIFVLGLLVFVHELGHFVIAKSFKMGVEEFGFGYPPRVVGFQRGGTTYSLNWIPIGGFVKITGENGQLPIDEMADDYRKQSKSDEINEKSLTEEANYVKKMFHGFDDKVYDELDTNKAKYEYLAETMESEKDKLDKNAFYNKPIWQRFLVLIAGVTMNVLLCVFLLSAGYMIGFPSATENLPAGAEVSNEQIIVMDTEEGRPAETAGLQTGDVIKEVNGQPIKTVEEFRAATQENDGKEMAMTIEREGETQVVKITPEQLDEGSVGVGAYLAETGLVKLPWHTAIWTGLKQTGMIIYLIFATLIKLVADAFTGQTEALEAVSGPVGIAVLANQAADLGFIYLLQFTALLSVNLAIFNLLPLPALDGGRIIFLIIEKIRRKPVSQKIEGMVHTIGFATLILLLGLVTIRDISKFNIFNSIKDFFL